MAETNTMPEYRTDPRIDSECAAAAARYRAASERLDDRSCWAVRMYTALNIFYWHIDAFEGEEDPRPGFRRAMDWGAGILESAADGGLPLGHFPSSEAAAADESDFEDRISGLFSDVWEGLTDDIYFDQSYEFTKQRMARNGVDPEALFGAKLVVDAGCGSGKYAAAIARFGARKVIGIDIGEKGIAFARAKAETAPFGDRLEYRHGSLLDLPLDDLSVDLVWSNGVVHHTLGYEKCIEEFARVLRAGGELYIYVDGPAGLFELMCDTFVAAHNDLPRILFQHYLGLLGIDSGRVYWIMDCLYAPYERKSPEEVETLLGTHGFTELRRLTRGLAIDTNEMIAAGVPFAEVKYGDGMLKYLAKKA